MTPPKLKYINGHNSLFILCVSKPESVRSIPNTYHIIWGTLESDRKSVVATDSSQYHTLDQCSQFMKFIKEL